MRARSSRTFPFALAVGLALVGALFAGAAPARAAEPLEVHFIDFGSHGDAILIRTPGGKSVLVDAGLAPGAERVGRYLEERKVEALDLLVLTHPDPDHVGGMPEVIRRVPVRRFWESAFPGAGGRAEAVRAELERRGARCEKVARGEALKLEPRVTLEVLSPASPWIDDGDSAENANSVVIRLTYGKTRVLLTGDAEARTEERLLADGVDLRCDLLKVAHHGSRSSTSEAFVRACKARIAVICCDRESPLGHPRPQVLDRLAAAGIDWYRTDVNGTVVARVGPGGGRDIEVRAERGEANDRTVNRVNPIESARRYGGALLGGGGGGGGGDGEPPADARFVGKIGRAVYHRADCIVGGRIARDDAVYWPSAEAAREDGRRACRICGGG